MTDEVKDATTEEREALLGEIAEQVLAKGGTFDEAKVREMLGETISELAKDDDFKRKMRFGGSDEDVGGKFRGMSPEHVDFLGTLMAANRGARSEVSLTGVHRGPSDELQAAWAESRVKAEKDVDPVYRDTLAKTRAMDTAEAGYGLELLGAQYIGSLWEASRLEGRIWPTITTFPMTAPTATVPCEVDFPDMLWVSESTAHNSSNFTTSKTGSNDLSVTAKKFVIHQMWSGEMEEDSIIPYIPFLSGQAAKSLAWHKDATVLLGDTTNAGTGNINEHDADPTDTDYFLAMDGIAHGAAVDNTNNSVDAAGAVTFEDLMNQRVLMWDSTYFHNWGAPKNPNDLIYVADVSTANAIAKLDEVMTVDKYGAQATVLSGEVAKVMRHPLIISDTMLLTAADGFVDTAKDGTKGRVIMYNPNGYKIGLRRALKVETERIPATDQNRIVYSMRFGLGRFTPTGAASGIESAAYLYDITV